MATIYLRGRPYPLTTTRIWDFARNAQDNPSYGGGRGPVVMRAWRAGDLELVAYTPAAAIVVSDEGDTRTFALDRYRGVADRRPEAPARGWVVGDEREEAVTVASVTLEVGTYPAGTPIELTIGTAALQDGDRLAFRSTRVGSGPADPGGVVRIVSEGGAR